MAKLSSKYFASVITKILAAKRRENIIIDEQLKSDLRAYLMERAGNMEIAPEKGSLFDFLVRWRYALALVPSAMLLMLVVSQFLKMPVSIESEVMVPTGGGSEVVEEGGDSSSDDLTSDVQGTSDVFEEAMGGTDTSGKKIKTFSGAEIMEQYKRDAQVDNLSAGGVAQNEVSVTKTTGEIIKFVPPYDIDGQSASSTSKESGTVDTAQSGDNQTALSTADMIVPSLKYPYYNYYVNGVKQDGFVLGNEVKVTGGGSKKDYSADAGALTTGGQSDSTGSTQGGSDTAGGAVSGDGMGGGTDTGTGDSGTDAGSGDSGTTVPYSQTLNPIPINDGMVIILPKIQVPIQTGTVPTTNSDMSSSVPSVPISNDSVSPSINLQNLVPISGGDASAVLPRTVEVLPIQYLTDLSSATKADLEKQVIMPMVLRGGVGSVSVSSMDDQGVLAVNVCYKGDGCGVDYYLKNNSTGAWDHVQYVTRTFTQGPSYTTRLQYTKSN